MCSVSATLCSVTAESITSETKNNWSGSVFASDIGCFVLTSFFPLSQILSCAELKAFENTSYNLCSSISIKAVASLLLPQKGLLEFKAVPCFAYQSSAFANAWQNMKIAQITGLVDTEKESDEVSKKPCCKAHSMGNFVCWFAIFYLESTGTDYHSTKVKKLLRLSTKSIYKVTGATNIQQGMTVWTSSCPFGDSAVSVFHGCVTKGILCNVVQGSALLIDACCLPGSEGGPVYSTECEFLGVIACLVVLKTQQIAGISIACSSSELFLSFLKCCCEESSLGKALACIHQIVSEICHPIGNFQSVVSSQSTPEVVALHHSKGWGTGVVTAVNLNSRQPSTIIIATCRHVVEPVFNKRLQAIFQCGSPNSLPLLAEVVYTSKEDSWLDFSLLKVMCSTNVAKKVLSQTKKCMESNNNLLYVIKYAKSYDKGECVVAKGHCLFETDSFKPTMTQGVLSSVVYPPIHAWPGRSHIPVLLHTTCIVHDGASGGALYSPSSHQLYGLIVCNVKEVYPNEKQVLYPQISFMLPAQIFMPSINAYLRGDTHWFSDLDQIAMNNVLSETWLRNENSNRKMTNLSKL